MIPKLHPKGKSFKGAALYLLHDKDHASSSDRVAWAQAFNFITDDPHMAWKIMVATSYSQDRLKAEAGIKNTGRKSKDHVLHLSLSWHPDEANGLTRDEMMKAAAGALKTLGADGHQAMVICHTDERQPHVHILVNRVSPEDGRMLSSSKEKEKLSRWAQAYEESRGQIFCNERVLNNAARDRGEFTRGAKDVPRHIMELEQTARKSVSPEAADKLSKELRQKDHAVATKARDIQTRHNAEWVDLYAEHKERKDHIQEEGTKAAAERVRTIRDSYRPRWRELQNKHRDQIKAFDRREESMAGRVENAFRGLNLKELVRENAPTKAFKQLFDTFASTGVRLAALKRIQKVEKRSLAKEQGTKERAAKLAANRMTTRKLSYERKDFFSKRSDLILNQSMDKAYVRSSWRKRDADRTEKWKQLVKSEELKRDFSKAANPMAEEQEKDRGGLSLEFIKQMADEIKAMTDARNQDRDMDRGR